MVPPARFDEARLAYEEGGFPALATRILEQLCANAVTETRFGDAAFYYYQLAVEALKVGSHARPPARTHGGGGGGGGA